MKLWISAIKNMFNNKEILNFRSIADASRYIVDNNLSHSKKAKNVATIISGILTGNYKNDYAYTFNFKYK